MRKEAVSLPELSCATRTYTYEITDSVREVASMVQMIAKTRTELVGLVSITLHFEPEGKISARQHAQIPQSVRYFLENLRSLVRKNDAVFLLGHVFHFVLPGANLQGARIVHERLWDALLWRVHNCSDEEILCPHSMSIGYSAYPAPCGKIDQCLEAASIACTHFHLTSETPGSKKEKPYDNDGELPLLARKLGIPYLSLLPRKLPAGVQHLVNPRLAQELQCYPVGREKDMLTVAMSNPQDRHALDRLARETGLHIFPVLAHPQELEMALAKLT